MGGLAGRRGQGPPALVSPDTMRKLHAPVIDTRSRGGVASTQKHQMPIKEMGYLLVGSHHHRTFPQSFSRWAEYSASFVFCIDAGPLPGTILCHGSNPCETGYTDAQWLTTRRQWAGGCVARRSRIGSDLLPPCALPAAHFDRNKIPPISRTDTSASYH